jgi:hypothetical protein
MKNYRSLSLALSILSPALLVFCGGCSKSTSDKVADAAQDTTNAVKAVAIDVKDDAVATWNSIKDYTFDKRSEFSASIKGSVQKMDDKVTDLKAKASTDSPEKAKALQAYDDARAELKVKLTDLGNATEATWADAKAGVNKAWDKVESAYADLTK